MVKIGQMVYWKAPILDGQRTSPIFPAVVYKLTDRLDIIGIVVFGYDNISTHRMAAVAYSEKPKESCWSLTAEGNNL
jgi:hypothetical protein